MSKEKVVMSGVGNKANNVIIQGGCPAICPVHYIALIIIT